MYKNNPGILPFILGIILVIAAILSNACSSSNLWLFILSGFLFGIYYGLNDQLIFHQPYTYNFYKKNEAVLRKLKIFPSVPQLNPVAKLHILWVHAVCGIIGGLTLSLLSIRNHDIEPSLTSYSIETIDFILILISVLAYVGLLPRTLWFLANKGGLDSKL